MVWSRNGSEAMIAIIDYGSGNIKAIENIYNKLNIPCFIAKKPGDLIDAEKIILPGVGAFDDAMTRLEQSGMRLALEERVLKDEIPLLGICIGMHLLAKSSEEGLLPGLGWLDAQVKRINFSDILLLPHMGWNSVKSTQDHPLFQHIQDHSRYYFLHSYYFSCNHEEHILAKTLYTHHFTSMVCQNRIFGVQFHPEKSHHVGMQLLKNFAGLSSC